MRCSHNALLTNVSLGGYTIGKKIQDLREQCLKSPINVMLLFPPKYNVMGRHYYRCVKLNLPKGTNKQKLQHWLWKKCNNLGAAITNQIEPHILCKDQLFCSEINYLLSDMYLQLKA